MGSTLSVVTCYKGGAKVAVVLADGKVEEYRKPVRVATVLQRHPQHMVVKLDPHGKQAERRRKVTFMRPDQRLKCKRQYVVLPNQSVGGRFVDCWTLASNATEFNGKRTQLKKLQGRRHSVAMPCASSAFNYSEEESFSTSLLDSQDRYLLSGTNSSTGMTQGIGMKISKPRHRNYFEWRPSLDSIPESPWPLRAVYNPYPY